MSEFNNYGLYSSNVTARSYLNYRSFKEQQLTENAIFAHKASYEIPKNNYDNY